jgi:hypothetical protein
MTTLEPAVNGAASSELAPRSPRDEQPIIFIVGTTAKHCSVGVDGYTRQIKLFEQLNGQGYIWELIFCATRELVAEQRMQPLSAVWDDKYRYMVDPTKDVKIARSIQDYKKNTIDIATWARIKEYFPAGRRAGDGKKGRLRLEGEFYDHAPAGTRLAQHFSIEERQQVASRASKLLIVYDDKDSRHRSSSVDAAESVAIVQTDGARNLWYPDDDDRLERTLFVTRSLVFNDQPQHGLGIRTRLSLDTALADLCHLIKLATQPDHDDERAKFLQRFRHLLVRIDCRATVYLRRTVAGGPLKYKLMFTPKPRHEVPGGYMLGNTTILTACLARRWAANPDAHWNETLIAEAVQEGFERARLHFSRGFCERSPEWAEPLGFGGWNTWVFHDEDGKPLVVPLTPLQTIEGELHSALGGRARGDLLAARLKSMGLAVPTSPGSVLVSSRSSARALRECAMAILERGAVAALEDKGLPYEEIGDYVLINSAEIDAFRALRQLLRRHIKDVRATKPFNLAVFGAPGSGKSFGVEQVAASLKQEGVSEAGLTLKLNLSQFRGPQDLCRAFHRVRNELLGGHVPLVFFDEFDCAANGEPYGWLKLFLAPMQDGKFVDGESEFNLGRPIFVFAGGTNRSFREMSGRVRGADFVAAKGPDFVSRLRWHVDIAGIDAPENANGADGVHELRRAILIRGLLERRRLWRKGDKQMPLDEGLARAFLEVSRFRHGARSIEAILSMCSGESGRQLRVMDLPPADLLDMHVDAREFLQRAREGSMAESAGGPVAAPLAEEVSESIFPERAAGT